MASSSSTGSAHAADTNFQARGVGNAFSCGGGCTQVSGNFSSNQISGTFLGRLNQVTTNSGCNNAQGTLTLYSGTNSAVLGLTGLLCGSHFFGDYNVTDGTGAYQEDGMGWGALALDTPGGAARYSASGAFYGQTARQTGVGYGN